MTWRERATWIVCIGLFLWAMFFILQGCAAVTGLAGAASAVRSEMELKEIKDRLKALEKDVFNE